MSQQRSKRADWSPLKRTLTNRGSGSKPEIEVNPSAGGPIAVHELAEMHAAKLPFLIENHRSSSGDLNAGLIIESTVRYLGIEVNDALEIAEQTEM